MKIIENSRQVPKTKDILANKEGYHDIIYCYLQVISKWDGKVDHPRYILKKDISFSKIGKVLGISRQTISKYFNRMLDTEENRLKGYVRLIKEKEDRYELAPLDKSLAMLVSQETLAILVSALNHNAISIFVYLLNRYLASSEKTFIFTFVELKSVIGLATSTYSNDYIISGILFVLEKLGLIEWRKKTEKAENGCKDLCYATYMSNEVKQCADLKNSLKSGLYKQLYG